MKKFLLSMAAVAVLGLSANAGTVTFDFTQNNYGLTPYEEDLGNNSPYVETPATISQGDVKIVFYGDIDNNATGWRMWSDGLREYYKRNPYFTVSTTNGEKVTYVAWTVVSGATFALEGTDTNITGWEGSEDQVTFVCTASSNKAIETITVGYGDFEGEIPVIPDAPTGVINVAQAIEYINAGGTDEITVKGIVTQIDSYNANYGSLTYWIGDEGSDATMEVYGGLSLNGSKFASESSIAIGAVVEVKGKVQIYQGTPEFSLNSELVSYLGPNGETAPSDEGGDNEGLAPEGVISVSEALNLYAEGYSGTVVVKGIVVVEGENKIQFNEQYGDMNYTIKDEKTDETLYIYNGYGLNGNKFESADDIEVGAVVVVEGTLTDYNGLVELGRGNILISYEAAGIEGITIDMNAPVSYYNLQGVRVNNPVKGGIYILRQGKTAKKAVIR